MHAPVTDRPTAIARIQRRVERLHSPRLQMMLIVALTGAAGLLASFALLHAGVDALWLRYPVAVAIAYLAFLFFLWCWLRVSTTDLLDFLDTPMYESTSSASSSSGCDVPLQAFEPSGNDSGGDAPQVARFSPEVNSGSCGSSPSLADAAGSFDSDELVVVVVAIVALVGAAWAALWMVWAAPALFAELLLDVGLSAGLYRRLRDVKGDHWLRTAMRRTALPFAAVALLFALAGAVMQAYAPDAKSLGQVLRWR